VIVARKYVVSPRLASEGDQEVVIGIGWDEPGDRMRIGPLVGSAAKVLHKLQGIFA